MNIDIANRLYQYRKQNGLSQEELAEKIGVSRQAVSKWERAESSPDTDNIILLAKLYNVSLDELLTTDEEINTEKDNSSNKAETNNNSEERTEYVNIGFNGIHVKDDESDVHIDFSGIHVKDKGGDEVHVDRNGVFVNGQKYDKEWWKEKHHPKSNVARAFNAFPYPILAILAFFLFGALNDGWGWSWIFFLTIPIYYTLISAIDKRDANIFCYPVLTVIAYILMGFFLNLWVWGWLVFLTIPIYYGITASINAGRKDKRKYDNCYNCKEYNCESCNENQ